MALIFFFFEQFCGSNLIIIKKVQKRQPPKIGEEKGERAEAAMGAYKAPISHFLSSPNPNVKTVRTPLVNLGTTSRRFLLFFLSSPILPATNTLALDNAKLLHSNITDALASSFDPVSQAEKDASSLISRRVSEAVELLERGKELQAQGDFPKALQFFTLVYSSIPHSLKPKNTSLGSFCCACFTYFYLPLV